MILKASKRAGSKQLADHLLNVDTNEHIFLEEVRGFMTQNNLNEALQEIYVQAKANPKVKKFMLSVSINPPANNVASKKSLIEAADSIEKRLGLTGQPRALVTHEKGGRRHMHAVFNLMDENLKVIKLDYYKRKLNDLSRELFLKHGWELPAGFKNKKERDITSFDLSEAHIAERQKLSPKEVKARIQQCWKSASDLNSLKQALSKEGFQLAQGDTKATYVLVDMDGEIRSLKRSLSIKDKEISAKIGKVEVLQSVDEAKKAISDTQKAQLIKTQADLEKRHEAQLVPLKTALFDMKIAHRKAREDLSKHHQKRQAFELKQRQKQYQSGLKKVWLFISGQYHHLKKKHEAQYQANLERDEQETESLVQQQLNERQVLQKPLEAMIQSHKAQLLQLRSGMAHRAVATEANIKITEGFNESRGHDNSPQNTRNHTQELEL